MIKITGCKSGSINHAPTITNLNYVPIGTSSIKISYHVEDVENQIVRHMILVNDGTGVKKTEITREVGYNKSDFEYILNSLNNQLQYTIQIEVSDGVSFSKSNIIEIKPPEKNYIYGIRIDENNSNPETAVTYIDDSVGMIPAKGSDWGSWKDKWPFNIIRPVGFKNGSVYKEIQKNDYTKYVDGELVGEDVDVMIEFPKTYWYLSKVGNLISMAISNMKMSEEFVCYAHTIGTREVDNIYIGAYMASNVDGRLRSIKGKTFVEDTMANLRKMAQANGTGYQRMCFYPNSMLQLLYLLMYKNLDSQTALGRGYADDVDVGSKVVGRTSSDGMLSSSHGNHMKFLGIEDWYGLQHKLIDGIRTDINGNLLISNQSVFNDNGTGYKIFSGYADDQRGWIKNVCGDNELLFLPLNGGGASNRNYCDSMNKYKNYLMRFGQDYNGANEVGAFTQQFTASYDEIFATRLIYLG